MPDTSFVGLVERLGEVSTRHGSGAYRDVAWDLPEHEVDPADPRWIAPAVWDPLGASEWYQDQVVELRSSIALYRIACVLKVGIAFEAVLCEGLLRFASRLPNGHPAFRFLYQEISDEAQHTLMFQEFINRSGFDPPGSDEQMRSQLKRAIGPSDEFPALFFVAALAGEAAFDFVQRKLLATPDAHPLISKVTRVHIAEEARHMSFARAYLRSTVPGLAARERRLLRYQAPFVIDWTSRRMLDQCEALVALYDLPHLVADEMSNGSVAKQLRLESNAKVVALCHELGLVDSRMERIWP